MNIHILPIGAYQANCYIIADEQTLEAMIIDPGGQPKKIIEVLEKNHYHVKYIVVTHGHGDHIGACDAIRDLTKAPLLVHAEDAHMLTDEKANLSGFVGQSFAAKAADKTLVDGEQLSVGKQIFTVIHTPGHTAGGICLYTEGHVFTGDTLFLESIGRSDFPGGDEGALIDNIKNKLFTLPEQTVVYPGHGGKTTIAREKIHNPIVGW
ncbi:MAG: MBL fold metallo-hydrolase [Hyphomonadaceae bacterium]|nr:MBL fold metallo-hydrolase [Clostridia bacterium]